MGLKRSQETRRLNERAGFSTGETVLFLKWL